VWGKIISISLDALKKYQVGKQFATYAIVKLSPACYIQVAQVNYAPGYKPWCHGAIGA
jgi:hypothetical protein